MNYPFLSAIGLNKHVKCSKCMCPFMFSCYGKYNILYASNEKLLVHTIFNIIDVHAPIGSHCVHFSC